MRKERIVPVLAVILVAAGLCVPGVAGAADFDEPRPGSTVRLARAGQPTLLGRVVEVGSDSITVQNASDKDPVYVPLREITRLELKKGRTRGQNALLGAGVGLALGLGVALIENSRCQGELLCGVEFALPVLTTPLGALVGVAIPGNQRWVEAPAAARQASRSGVRVAWSVGF